MTVRRFSFIPSDPLFPPLFHRSGVSGLDSPTQRRVAAARPATPSQPFRREDRLRQFTPSAPVAVTTRARPLATIVLVLAATWATKCLIFLVRRPVSGYP
jgi:hypothetical protein